MANTGGQIVDRERILAIRAEAEKQGLNAAQFAVILNLMLFARLYQVARPNSTSHSVSDRFTGQLISEHSPTENPPVAGTNHGLRYSALWHQCCTACRVC